MAKLTPSRPTHVHTHARTHTLQFATQVRSLSGSLRDLSDLSDAVKVAGAEQLRREVESLRNRAAASEEALRLEQAAAKAAKAKAAELDSLSTSELQAYRNKFHHLRRVATEQAAKLAAEKRALLDQIEELSSAEGQKQHAKEVSDHFRAQMESAEHARVAREEALSSEIASLQSALSRERERSEKRAQQHAQEMRAQVAASDERALMNKAQAGVDAEGKSAQSNAMAKLEREMAAMERRHELLQARMQGELEQVREVAKEREGKLQRMLARARSDHMAELRAVQIQAAEGKLGGGRAVDEAVSAESVVDALREENRLLTEQMEGIRDQFRERETKAHETLQRMKGHFARIQGSIQ